MQKQKAMHYKTKKRNKMEFSKKWLIWCVIISIIFSLLSYILAFFDKNTVESLSATIIETLWGTSGISFIGYALQNCVRAYTASKFGLPDEANKDNDSIESG